MSRQRWIVAGLAAVLIAGGAALLLFAPKDQPSESSAASPGSASTGPVAAAPADVSEETQSAPAEKTEDTSKPSEAPAAFPSSAERRERTGRGRVFGKASLPEGTGRAEISIALHRVPGYQDAEFSYDETLVGETTAAATDGAFEFTALPIGSYVLLATAPGFTINGSATLSAERLEDETNLSLVPGGNISGRVVDQERQPIAGARVFVGAWDIQGQQSFAPRERALASQRHSDETGAFTITNLRKSLNNEPGYRLAVKAEGFTTFLSDYVQAGATGVELVLKPGGIVSGMLLDSTTGEALAEKTIAVESDLTFDNLTAKTDAEGFFFLHDLPPGALTASLRDDDLVITPESAKFVVAAEGPTDEVTLYATPGGRISGRVYNADTAEGIAGVQLYARAREVSDSRRREVKTGADGSYEFRGLREASYTVSHRKPDGYPQPRNNDEERLVTASVGAVTSGVDFALSRGLTVSGRVVDESGKPIAQASVSGSGNNAWDYTQTKEDGGFLLAGFQTGQSVSVSAEKEGYAMVSTEPDGGRITIGDAGATGVKIVFGAEGSISGTVVDAAGKPKGRVEVHARNTAKGLQSNIPNATSNPDGTIKIGQLSPGEYYFIFPRDGMYRDPGPNAGQQKIRVAKGEQIKGARILYIDDTQSGSLAISGRVTDSQGKPVVGATLLVDGMNRRETRTDAAGNYTLAGFSEGQYSVQAVSYGHSTGVPRTAQAGDKGVDFVLKGLATIEGRVVSAETGRPVTSFRVRAQGGRRYFVRDQFLAVQDAEGRFKLGSVEDGTSALEVRAEGLADARVPLSGIVGGDTRRDVVVKMEGGVEVSGRVVDESGKGIGGAQIFLGAAPAEWQQNEMKRASSAADGSFHLTSLPSGPVQISASHPKFASKTVSASLVPRVENKVEIVLTSGAVVEGTITVDSKPAAGANMNVSASRGGESKQGETDTNGFYRIAGLPEGQVHINAWVGNVPGMGSRGKNAQAEVREGYVTEMNFKFVSGSSTVEGVIYEAPNKPLQQQAHVNLSLQAADGTSEHMGVQSDANGAFLFEGVPAGQARIQLYIEGRQPKSAGVTVGDRQRVQKDILLYGGATLHVSVSGGEAQTVVLLITGVVQITELTMPVIMDLQSKTVAQSESNGNEVTLTGLDAGTYTALVVSIAPGAEGSGDPLNGAKWATRQVEMTQDQEASIQVGL